MSGSITSITALNAAILSADSAAANSGVLTIDLSGDIALGGTALDAINLKAGVTLDIVGVGASNTLDGGGLERGLFVYSGAVTIDNLALNDFTATGGAGTGGAGGGAGLGGALYIGASGAVAGSVTLDNVTFTGDKAVGGVGGGAVTGSAGGGGGGGLGGAGGSGGGGIANKVAVAGGGGGGGGIGGGFGGSGGSGGLGGAGKSLSGSAGVKGLAPTAAAAGAGATTKDATGGAAGLSGGGGGGGAAGNGGGFGAGGGGGIGGATATFTGTTTTGTSVAGAGGYGGGGGGGAGGASAGAGGAGGFGGGGGGGGYSKGVVAAVGGAGGFGGGGGSGALGGFGAGNGYVKGGTGGTFGSHATGGGGATGSTGPTSGSGGGGGGLAAGGDIFVQAGASLTIAATASAGTASVGAATATGGAATNGQAGIGLASGIYLQGAGSTLNFATATTQTVAGVIGDDKGSAAAANYGGVAGYTEGAVGIAKSGAGTLTLSAANTYTGGTALNAGTLDLANPKAAGTGAITFLANSDTTLKIEKSDAPANTIIKFLPFDTIDLANIGLANTFSLSATNVLTVSGGTSTGSVSLNLDPTQNYAPYTFGLLPDGAGGTDVIFLQPITITPGTQSVGISDQQTVTPFTQNTTLKTVVTDPNPSQTETLTVTLSNGANGTLSDAAGGTITNGGTYTISGVTAAVASADLTALVFTPTPHEAAPGTVVATVFNVTDKDTSGVSATATATVDVTVALLPISITPATQSGATTDEATITPFTQNAAHVTTVNDVNYGATETLTVIASSTANGTLSDPLGGTITAGGTYTISGVTAAQASADLTALVFTPTAHEAVPGTVFTTSFAVSDTDSYGEKATATASVAATVVVTPISITPVTQSGTTTDEATYTPFTQNSTHVTTVNDLNVGALETLTVIASSTANGTLSDPLGGTIIAGGTYTISGVTAAAASADLSALVFTPTKHEAAPGTVFTTTFAVSDTDSYAQSATATASVATTVIATPISITPSSQSGTTTDENSITPFTQNASLATVVNDLNVGALETLTVTLSNAANGTLTDIAGGTVNGGTYTVSGVTAAQASADLTALVFTPTAHQATPGTTVTTGFNVTDADQYGESTTATASVAATAVNDAPVVSITQIVPMCGSTGDSINDCQTVQPFADSSVTDPDANVTDSLKIVLENSSGAATDCNGTLSGTGLTKTATGTYVLAAATPATLTAEFQALVFTPTEREVAPGKTVATTFAVTATQTVPGGGTTTSATNTSTVVTVTGMNYICGLPFGFSVIVGTCNPDMITAYGYFNSIYGQGGNDCIVAGCGNAYVNIPSGNTTIQLGGGSNNVAGGCDNGNNVVTGGPGGCNTVTLGNGCNEVEVGGCNDTITLGCGNNWVSGTTGAAFICTGSGNNIITIGGSGSTVDATGGQNTIIGGCGNDTFEGPAAGCGFNTVSNFTESNCDVLDLGKALCATNWNGCSNTLANYLKVTDSGGNTMISIANCGTGAGVGIMELKGVSYGYADLLCHIHT